MALAQQQRPHSSRRISYNLPESVSEVVISRQIRPLEQSEEWVLFSPVPPSTTQTSTDRTPRASGLSRLSEFGSLDTAARSGQNDANSLEDLDSLDDGLHAFHEPSDYGAPVMHHEQLGETVLPTHDGFGGFQPNVAIQEHMWQFERPRRRLVRRRSSLDRHLSILEIVEDANTEQERRQRIERWRLDQSKALLDEIEKETRRSRRVGTMSAQQSPARSTRQNALEPAFLAQDASSDSEDEGPQSSPLWQKITTRVIRDLIGLDEDMLSVMFGEALPEEATTPRAGFPVQCSADKALQYAGNDTFTYADENWKTKLLARVAQELGVLVHQLSEHPGAFSTYQADSNYISVASSGSGMTFRCRPVLDTPLLWRSSAPHSMQLPVSAQFGPTFHATSHLHDEPSLWGIEEEPEVDPLDSFHPNVAEDLVRERDYWEQELDVKMIFNFLVKRFTSHRSKPQHFPSSSLGHGTGSVCRAAMIRQNHPLVSSTMDRRHPSPSDLREREATRVATKKDYAYRTYSTSPPSMLRHQKLRPASSCASLSTKQSKRSGTSERNYWDLGGSVCSRGLISGEAV